jgi:hypothetical protein
MRDWRNEVDEMFNDRDDCRCKPDDELARDMLDEIERLHENLAVIGNETEMLKLGHIRIPHLIRVIAIRTSGKSE